MHVERLKLINFRNYEELDISFEKGKNIFYGHNAQGKTNILEALYFISCAKSHRTSKDKELINLKNDEAYIGVYVKKNNSDVKIDAKISKNEKKYIKINGTPIKKIGELFGNLNAIIFSPEDLSLVKEGPSEKRRFLDIGISQIKPSYFYILQQYHKVIFQRNSLLKEIKRSRKHVDTLSVWNNYIIEMGSKIMYYRKEHLNNISSLMQNIHRNIAKEEIEVKYIPSIKEENFKDIEEIKNILKNNLEISIENDINCGLTTIGPHRDNFEIFINGINSRNYASQGQQRTAVLSLKLSEIELFKNELGEYPILLLDDVMSELDKERQQFLIEYIKNIQTFITCTNEEDFDKEKACFYKVKEGHVEKQ